MKTPDSKLIHKLNAAQGLAYSALEKDLDESSFGQNDEFRDLLEDLCMQFDRIYDWIHHPETRKTKTVGKYFVSPAAHA